jgi:hypothetical protein
MLISPVRWANRINLENMDKGEIFFQLSMMMIMMLVVAIFSYEIILISRAYLSILGI